MELIDLKEVWDRVEEKESEKFQLPEESVVNAIRKQSNTTFSKILRAIRYKVLISTIASIASYLSVPAYILKSAEESFFLGILSGIEVGIMMILVGTLLLGISINYRISYRMIKTNQISAKPLKESIQEAIDIILKINRISIYSDAYGVPLFLGWILYAALFKHFEISSIWGSLIITGICYASFVLVEAKGKWLTNKKYGDYLSVLESSLKELQEKNMHQV
ncbi:MAG: hypothetical protein AAF363_09355 [Bacteroidota bacterium]